MSAPADAQVAQALAALRRLIPGGGPQAITAALTVLAGRGDAAGLREAEAHLATVALRLDYGDRDDDPPPWELDARAFALLVRWWRRLDLIEERAAWLAADWLGAAGHFGGNSFTLFTRAAPFLAPQLAPLLVAACADRRAERRARAAAGLRYTPTAAALDCLAALLGDRSAQVASQAQHSLNLLAYPNAPAPSAPDAVAVRLVAALGAEPAAVRRRAVAALAWFAGLQHRHSVSLPPQFALVLPALARLLADPDPELRRLAARRVCAAGYHLDMLRPSRAAALVPDLRLPALDLGALLASDDPELVRAALSLAGRSSDPGDPPDGEALAAQILALIDRLGNDILGRLAALHALGRLGATAAIPLLVAHLARPREAGYAEAALVLAQLGHPSVIPHLEALQHDLTYGADAREALDALLRP